jgi:hypothetical protein
MKRFLFFMMAVFALVSCDDSNDDEIGVIGDFNPIEFMFDVTNSAGESLIDKDSPAYDADFVANTYIKFQGKVYKMEEDAKGRVTPSTRAISECFHGIMTEQLVYGNYEATKVVARVGPFLPDYDWKSEEIEIHWGDNSEDKIVFTSVITSWKDKWYPVWSQKYMFNGVDCTETLKKMPYGYMQLVKSSTKGN